MRHSDKNELNRVMAMNRAVDRNEIEPQRLLQVLRQLGYELKRCAIFEMYPDSGQTWIVRLMKHDGSIDEIDVDLIDSNECKIESVNPAKYRKRSNLKTLNAAKVALKRHETRIGAR